MGGATNCPFPKAEFLLNEGQKVSQHPTTTTCSDITNFPSPPLFPSLFSFSPSPQLLSSGQHYHISLQLQAPESPVNEAIGVFMVNITLYTTGQQFLSTSARPVSYLWGNYRGSDLFPLSIKPRVSCTQPRPYADSGYFVCMCMRQGGRELLCTCVCVCVCVCTGNGEVQVFPPSHYLDFCLCRSSVAGSVESGTRS